VTAHKIPLSKDTYTENVIRKSLYWMSGTTDWTLDENENTWYVELESDKEDNIKKFNRLLNDQVLREKIDSETGMIRRSIIRKVLKSLDSSL